MKRKGLLSLGLFSMTAFSQMPMGADPFMTSMTASMKRMDQGMSAAPMSGEVDSEFVDMMIPHHEGAIDMAKAELQYGKDPVMRRMAQEIIADQVSKVQAMQLWSSRHPMRSKTEARSH